MELKESLLQIAERGFLFCRGGFQGFLAPSFIMTGSIQIGIEGVFQCGIRLDLIAALTANCFQGKIKR